MFSSKLEDILYGLNRLTAKLESYVINMDIETDQLSDNIVALENQRMAAINDKAKAKKVLGNIKKMLGE